MKNLMIIAFLLLASGCGHILLEGDVLNTNCPRWQPGQEFHVFHSEPATAYVDISTLVAVSDVGNYPSTNDVVRSAQRFALKNGGNGVIINPGCRTDGPRPSNQYRVIYLPVEK